MPLSPNQLQHRCLQYQGSQTCRYLQWGSTGQECVKHLSGLKKTADDKVAKLKEDCKKNHILPSSQWQPIGDGGTCPGYLYLPTQVQGYDQKPKK